MDSIQPFKIALAVEPKSLPIAIELIVGTVPDVSCVDLAAYRKSKQAQLDLFK